MRSSINEKNENNDEEENGNDDDNDNDDSDEEDEDVTDDAEIDDLVNSMALKPGTQDTTLGRNIESLLTNMWT